MGIIFDLDQTLVDSKFIEPYRRPGGWGTVRKLISQLQPYPCIDEIMRKLNQENIPIAIVTNSPGFYSDLILKHLNWTVQGRVCYHDVQRGYHKPHPLPIQKALSCLGVKDNGSALSFGDRDIDVIASKRAGAHAIGCLWGCDDQVALRRSRPDTILSSTAEMKEYLSDRLSLKF